jgi:hypothetical protein
MADVYLRNQNGDKEPLLAMRFQQALQAGKKYLRLPTGRKDPIRNQHPPSKGLKPEGFTGHPGGGLYSMAKDNLQPMPKEEVGPSGAEKKALLLTGGKERESDLPEWGNRSGFPKIPTDQRFLNSFPERKKAELRECSRGSEGLKPDHGAEDQIAVVFSLTRRLLSKTEPPLDSRLIRDEDRLERALGKIHPRLPISIRLILWKKRYIQLMLDNRERLIP